MEFFVFRFFYVCPQKDLNLLLIKVIPYPEVEKLGKFSKRHLGGWPVEICRLQRRNKSECRVRARISIHFYSNHVCPRHGSYFYYYNIFSGGFRRFVRTTQFVWCWYDFRILRNTENHAASLAWYIYTSSRRLKHRRLYRGLFSTKEGELCVSGPFPWLTCHGIEIFIKIIFIFVVDCNKL